ncbi:unnamed protein product [Effrenium voratum]|nr:unnamed protein product [Effrenium voratum]
MVTMLGVDASCLQYEYARRSLQEALPERHDKDSGLDPMYLPSKHGFVLHLGDGVESRLRFWVREEGSHRFKLPEFRLPNRDIPMPENLDIATLAKRVINCFEQPNRVLEMTPDAQAVFSGFQASFNVQQSLQRSRDNAAAGRLGTAPWHLAVLSASKLVWDVAMGEISTSDDLRVQTQHVLRAFDEVQLCQAQIALWTSESVPAKADRPDCGHLASLLTSAERLQAACEAAPMPSQFAVFECTQQQPLALEDASAEEVLEAAAGPAAGPEPPKVLMLSDAEVPPLSDGYGPGGASAQDPGLGPVLFTDRAIMQKTLLRGEAVIYGSKVLESMSKKTPIESGPGEKKKYTRCSLKLAHWKQVMKAGLRKWRVGEYDSGDEAPDRRGHPRVIMSLPDSNDQSELLEYHNRLMLLCNLPYTAVAERIAAKAGKSKKEAARSAGHGDTEPARSEKRQRL